MPAKVEEALQSVYGFMRITSLPDFDRRAALQHAFCQSGDEDDLKFARGFGYWISAQPPLTRNFSSYH